MQAVEVPGSKSISNRALLLSSIGASPVVLENLLLSEDVEYMIEALRAFGVKITFIGKHTVEVTPPEKFIPHKQKIFIGNAGTAARFLSALSLLVEGDFILDGVPRMRERPQKDLLASLASLGKTFYPLEKEGHLPIKFSFSKQTLLLLSQKKPKVQIKAQVSSQFLSALLLIAPALPHGLQIEVEGSIPSLPYIEMTLQLLRIWGVRVYHTEDYTNIEVLPGMIPPAKYLIPSDMTAASYPLVWSMLRGQPIVIENFGRQTLQGDEAFLEVIQEAGANIQRRDHRCFITPPKTLKKIKDRNWETMPDVSMSGMVLASAIPAKTCFFGLESLPVKECHRIKAMEQLSLFGIPLEADEKSLCLEGKPLGEQKKYTKDNPITINSYDDHRIAMCFGVLKAALGYGADPFQKSPIKITNPACTKKTWPDFWLHLADWEEELRPVSAVILQKGKKFLLVKKPRKHFAWQFPQGGVEAQESALRAAKRELKEECGSDLRVKFLGERPLGVYRYFFPEDFARHQGRFLGAKVYFFAAKYLGGEVNLDPNELEDYAWLTPENIKARVEPAYWEAIKYYLSSLSSEA